MRINRAINAALVHTTTGVLMRSGAVYVNATPLFANVTKTFHSYI